MKISYRDWCGFLERSGAVCGPAEMQGYLCGVLCNGQKVSRQDWLLAVLDFMDIEGSAAPEAEGAMEAIFDLTQSALQDDSYGLELLLPTDDRPMSERASSLAAWVQGFLHGIATAGDLTSQLDEEGESVLRDLSQIAQLDEEEEESEENEVSITELGEYVRCAVFNLYSQLQSVVPSQSSDASLH